MTDIALLILTSLSLIGLIFVIFIFLKLSQKFENLKLDISNAFKDKSEVAVLNINAEKDLMTIKENIVSFTKQLQEYLNNSMGKIREETKKTADLLENLNSIEVSLIWEPKWHKDLMSEEAKLALDIF